MAFGSSSTVCKMINKQSATGNRLPASVRRDRACQGTWPIPLPATGAPPDLRGFLPGRYDELRRLPVPQNDCKIRVTTRPFFFAKRRYAKLRLCSPVSESSCFCFRGRLDRLSAALGLTMRDGPAALASPNLGAQIPWPRLSFEIWNNGSLAYKITRICLVPCSQV